MRRSNAPIPTPAAEMSPLQVLPKLAYSIDDACSISGLSKTFFYRAWRAGGGPKKIKAGKRTLISDESLRAWLRSLEYRENDEP
ncbi:MAG: helix-turn-helix domain-containing protein [Proteobacteria bacterium]|nr:helix-turn-helix domain-containing protein [Pseudomonadota bacterium]